MAADTKEKVADLYVVLILFIVGFFTHYITTYVPERVLPIEIPVAPIVYVDFPKEVEEPEPISFGWPIHIDDYKALSSPYGERDPENIGGYGDEFHDGIDLYGTYHARIIASLDGTVLVHFYPPGGFYEGHPVLGGLIIIQHVIRGETYWSKYGHLSETKIHEGDDIIAGQYIGRQGNTGRTASEHLHFEIIQGGSIVIDTGEIIGGERLNPLMYMEEPNGI